MNRTKGTPHTMAQAISDAIEYYNEAPNERNLIVEIEMHIAEWLRNKVTPTVAKDRSQIAMTIIQRLGLRVSRDEPLVLDDVSKSGACRFPIIRLD